MISSPHDEEWTFPTAVASKPAGDFPRYKATPSVAKRGTSTNDAATEAQRKRDKRADDRVIDIPRVQDWKRRTDLEQDDVAWLRWYFGDGCSSNIEAFTYQFTKQQLFMIESIGRAMDPASDYGDQSIAASRGEGKSMIARRCLLKYMLQGSLDVAMLIGSTATDAGNSLETLRAEIDGNDRLFADYPEVVAPVRSIAGSPQRASSLLVNGVNEHTNEPYEKVLARFKWSGDVLTFPTVPGSRSYDACLSTAGLEGAIRGYNYRGRRPKLVIIDDPDTEDTSESESAAIKLEKRIDGALGGLGTQTQRIRRIMLTSIQSKTSVSAKFTDPKQKPSWHGVRFRFLITRPTNADLWDKYIQVYQDDFRLGTRHAADFYAENREAMDLGAEVSNPNRKEPHELSALQHYFNLIAILGPDRVAAEYDNDPVDSLAMDSDQIQWQSICKRLNGHKRGFIPRGYTIVTVGCDVGKWKIDWTARAWRPDGRFPITIDYGEVETIGAKRGKDNTEGLDEAIAGALVELKENVIGNGWECEAGGFALPKRAYVDTRYRAEAVVEWCLANPGWHPVAGHGQSSGTVGGKFSDVFRRTKDRRPCCAGVFEVRRSHNGRQYWHTALDVDLWKRWEHDRWSTPMDRDGKIEPRAMTLWGVGDRDVQRLVGDEIEHREYAQEICNEYEVGGKWRAFGPNHKLDSSAYADAAAAREGVPMQGSTEVAPQAQQKPMTLAEMYAIATGRR